MVRRETGGGQRMGEDKHGRKREKTKIMGDVNRGYGGESKTGNTIIEHR